MLLGSSVLSSPCAFSVTSTARYRSNPYSRETRHEFGEFGEARQNGKQGRAEF